MLKTTTNHSLSDFRKSPLDFLRLVASEAPSLICLSGVRAPVVLLSDPDLIEKVLHDESGCYSKGPFPNAVRPILGDGTAASWFPPKAPDNYEPYSHLHDFRLQKRAAIHASLRTIETTQTATFKKLAREFSKTCEAGQIIDAYAAMHDLMFRMTLAGLFHLEVTNELVELNVIIRRSAPIVYSYLRSRWGISFPYFDRVYAPHYEAWRWLPGPLSHALRARRQAVDNLADLLIHHAQTSEQAENSLGRAYVDLCQHPESRSPHWCRSAVIGLLFASYEGSAAVAAWALWHLAAHPEWQERIAAEITSPTPSFDAFSDLCLSSPSLRALLHETMRLYPPVWSIGRVTKSSVQLGNFNFAAGTTVIVSPWLQHHHPKLWENSEHFRPERFQSAKTFDGTFLPFGSKPRECPGEYFAWLTLTIILCELVKSWRLTLMDSEPPLPLFGLTQRPKNAVMVQFIPRL